MQAFVDDTSPNAYEKVVDRLLASPRYGERMAIRWLEAARYADTNGYQTDGPREMWPWRDWVIKAFQRDMPWDQFTVEQLAGDLLPNATLAQQIATGFNRNHRTSAEGGIVDEEFRVEYVADRAETTSAVWLGLTVGCARCHDHKFDPISQKDYYSLFAFFNNVPEKGFVWNFGNEDPVIKAPLPDQQAKLDEFQRRIDTQQARVKQLEPEAAKAQAKWEKKVRKSRTPVEWTVTAGRQLHHAATEQGVVTIEKGPKFNYRDPFSFSVRVKPESLKGNQAILSKGDDYWEGQQHGLYLIDGKVRLHVIFRWTDLGMRVETAEPLKQGEWQQLAVTYDGGMKASGVRIWVDGRPQKINVLFDSLLWPIDSKEPWRIGAGGGMRFNGSVADVAVYDRAIAEDEVAVLNVAEPVDAIARKKNRTQAENDKLRLCFDEQFAPARVMQARADLGRAIKERDDVLQDGAECNGDART